VVIEFLGALNITINMILLSTLFNGPFLALANPDKTPNPSKAPWYFLNLQELLLHMNPALAGVIVPTVALILIAVIPYVDRGTEGLGIWWYSARGPKIAIFTAVYTTMVAAALIALDKFFPLKSNFTTWYRTADVSTTHESGALSFMTDALAGILGGTSPDVAHANAVGILVEATVGWIIPIICFIVFPILLVILLKAVFRGINKTEIIIGLFTGFVTLYFVLTFVGTAMRGPSMDLYPPWALPPNQEG
jgi:quinol-cytochrome oxidoreductase complex cytochrome b subunit